MIKDLLIVYFLIVILVFLIDVISMISGVIINDFGYCFDLGFCE